MDAQIDTDARELVMVREFAAPISLMFKVWTQPEHMARWWGCPAVDSVKVTADLRVGGKYRAVMQLSDGNVHRVTGAYREIVEPDRISFTWAWEDADGNPGHETLVTVTLRAKGDKTEMTLRHAIFETAEACNLHHEGWSTSFERLDGNILIYRN